MSGLSTIVNGLKVSEAAIQIASKNVSNVHTEGYKRQRTLQSEIVGGMAATGYHIGLGAKIDQIQQVYNTLKEEAYQESLANLGEYEIENDIYTYIESALGLTNNDTKGKDQKGVFESTLENIWAATNTLATDPSSLTYRLAFHESIVAFLNETETAMSKLDSLQEEINTEIGDVVTKINELADEICKLNEKINYATAMNRDVLELKDKRSSVIEELSKLIEVKVETCPNSESLLIRCGGGYLVSKSEVNPIELAQNTIQSIYDIPVWRNTQQPIELTSGRLKGLLDSRGHNIVGNLTDPTNGSPRENVEIEVYIDNSMTDADVRANIETMKSRLDAHGVNYTINIKNVTDVVDSINNDLDTDAFDDKSNKYLMVFTNEDIGGDINSAVSKLKSINMRVIAVVDDTQPDLVDSLRNLTVPTEGSIYSANAEYEELGDNLAYNVNARLQDQEYDGIIAKVKSQLSSLVSAFVRVVNEVFTDGWNENGVQNTDGSLDIFQKMEPSLPWQIGNIKLNDKFSDLNNLPLSASGAIGDNTLVEKLVEMRDVNIFNDANAALNIDGYYEKMVLDLGTEASQVLSSLQNQEDIVRDADNARKAVSGVSLDEELANIIKFQYAYTGASRMLTVLDEMTEVIQSLI
ncbi:MAG: hypothetical protein E7314_01775 [Clostridiales bacterium]|nr:hypothetical protein [Clostridiales bacterium]